MGLITPVKNDSVGRGSAPGRPVGERTLEIMAEIQLNEALGRIVFSMELEEQESKRFERFSSKARTAARLCERKVRVRRLGDDRAEITLLGG